MPRMFLLSTLCASIMLAAAAQAAEPTTADSIAALKSQDKAARLEAIVHLGSQGAKAAEAVPALTGLLADPDANVRGHAAYALGQIGEAAKPAAPELAKLVGDAEPGVRRKALTAIRQIRPGKDVTIPLFVKLMGDPHTGVRIRAMSAMAQAGEEAVPFLLGALKDEKAAFWACVVLRDIGPQAKAAVPALTQLAADPRPEIRHEAILALGAIGPDAAPAVPALVKALDDKLVDQAAAFALGLIGTMPADAQAKLRTMINDPDQVLRVTAIWALAKPHKDNQAYMRWATEALVIFLKHPDTRIRKAAASALGDLQPPPEITMPIVDAAFKDADDKVVAHAVEAIAGLGPKVVPGLIRVLRFERIRPRVAELLGEMGPAAAPAVEALTGLLGDKNPETRKQAAIALAKIGPASKPAVPALIKALEKGLEEEGEVATGAAYALGKIGPDAAAAKPVLLKVLEGKDDAATLVSAWALGQIAPKDEECAAKAVPVLARGLSDADAKYRAGAAQALKAFGPLAKSAVPALEKAAKDEDQAVQEAAAEALKAVGN